MTNEGHSRGKTADSIYNMYKASVSSRFPRNGKLVMLSFPRYKDDFISKRYNDVIADRVTEYRTHTFKIHDDLADGLEDNEFTIEWEHDNIISYRESDVFALKRPTWYVNPTISVDDLKQDFIRNPGDSLTRFACMPSDAIDAFFKDKNKIDIAFPETISGPFNEDWSWKPSFRPKNKSYYLHVDLAYSHDRAAVAMASIHDWVTIKYSPTIQYLVPIVSVDAVRYWTPTPDQNIDLEDIKKFILDVKMAGFKLKLVTFDRWNSLSYREQLKKDFGIQTDVLSVAKPHYEDFASALMEERIRGYSLPLLTEELLGLRVIRGNKVDHQKKGSKDVSDAVVGAVYNVIAHEKSNDELPEVEVRLGGFTEEEPQQPRKMSAPTNFQTANRKKMPKGLSDFISTRSEERPAAGEKKAPQKTSPVQKVDLALYMDGDQVV
jgi:hypothetical protein